MCSGLSAVVPEASSVPFCWGYGAYFTYFRTRNDLFFIIHLIRRHFSYLQANQNISCFLISCQFLWFLGPHYAFKGQVIGIITLQHLCFVKAKSNWDNILDMCMFLPSADEWKQVSDLKKLGKFLPLGVSRIHKDVLSLITLICQFWKNPQNKKRTF